MSDQTPNEIHQNVSDVTIEDELRGAYLDYAMSVIVGRALPDVRDGLKPVHRRVLFAMYDLGNTHNKAYKKSARVVGDVIGKYHPHGDTAVYDSMVRLAQDFTMRLPLVDGQGNFGSIDGDSPAAMRYTEVRMTRAAEGMLEDLDKDTVDFGPNYDDSLKEPLVLPTRIPNLIVNGSSGIAVGMATSIPPHNLQEVSDAIVALIEKPELKTDDLMQFVKGPDFPTAAYIVDGSGLRNAYRTGRGTIAMRAKAEIEVGKNDREKIIVTELPYQVNKAKLIEKIADLVRNKKIEGISDLRDESDRTGMRIVIEIKKGDSGNVVLNQLYKLTQLQDSFSINLLAIHHKQPKLFNLRDMLWAFIEHRREVVTRRTLFELNKAEARAHILEGLKIAVENIDEVVELIKKSGNPEEAKTNLISRFSFSEKQAQAILDLRLQRLTGLERDKIIDEYHEILKLIAHLKKILGSEKLIFDIIREETLEMREKFGNPRRTEIMLGASTDFSAEELIQDEETFVTITHSGYIKRTDPTVFRSQKRGGKGIKGMKAGDDEDFAKALYQTRTHDYLLCFSNTGKLHWLKVYQIPEASRTSKGRAIVNLIQMSSSESIKAILPVSGFSDDQYVIMVTRNGVIKKTKLSDFKNVRAAGIIAVSIKDGDELVSAKLSDGKSDIFLCSRQGMSIRFPEDHVRSMGRTASGVTGINLRDDDVVVGLEVLKKDTASGEILTVTENGYGKRTPMDEYRVQSRAGKGIITLKITDKNGPVVGTAQVSDRDDLMIVSNKGQMIRIRIGEISEQGRNTQGVRLMNVGDSEKVVAIEYLAETEQGEDEGSESE